MKKLALLLCLLAGPAMAQPKLPQLPKFPLPEPPAARTSAPDPQKLFESLLKLPIPDLQYASKLAARKGTPAANVRKQCVDQILKTIQSATDDLKDDAGNVIPRPDPSLFTHLEMTAEAFEDLQPNGDLFTNCAGAARLVDMNVLQFMNALVTGTAAAAILVPK